MLCFTLPLQCYIVAFYFLALCFQLLNIILNSLIHAFDRLKLMHEAGINPLDGLVAALLDLVDHALPLTRRTLPLFVLYPNNYMPREVLFIPQLFLTHERLPLPDHIDLIFEALSDHLGHAVLIALVDHCDDEVHEYNISHEHNHEPDQPCQRLVIALVVTHLVVTERSP